MTPQERVIATARAEIGYLEKKTNSQLDSKTANAGEYNFTKYGRDLDALNFYNGKKNGYAWCNQFFDWCFVKTFGLNDALKMIFKSLKNDGASCTSSMGYYKAKKRFYKSGQPADQIFFTKDNGVHAYHTGIVEKIQNGIVYTIEGNTSGMTGVVDNGGGVFAKSYSVNSKYIAGYGRPDWSIVKEEEKVTYDEWKAFMTQYRKELQDNDASASSKEAREWAIKDGLIGGNGTINGEPNYMWEDFVNRQQFVTVFHRWAKKHGLL